MKRPKKIWLFILSLFFAALVFTGCGSSTSKKDSDDGDPTPSSVMTGDISLFPNAGLLASAEDLLDDDDERVIVDTRSAEAYAAGHIPDAINLHWDSFAVWDESAPKANLLPVADLAAELGAAGLTRDVKIVFYDDTVSSWGSAGRFFWMLEYLGHTHVQILNGGWDKWASDDLPTETTVNHLSAAEFVPDVNISVVVDKDHIAGRLGADDFVAVDTRTDEEYIGWTLYEETRGGHIPDAVQLPYKWYYNEDKSILSYEDLKDLLESHGVTSDKEVVAYCTAGIRSGFFYFLGRLMGYEQVANYDGSMWDWAAAEASTYPMDKYPNYQALVYPAWVNELINGGTPTTYPGNGYVVIDAMSFRGGDNTDTYDAGHIPQAIHLNIYALEGGYPDYPYASPAAGNLLPDIQLQAFIEDMGISKDTTVILYGSSLTHAGRAAWALMYAGVEDVRILNGGYNAWVDAGYDVETTSNTPSSVVFGAAVPVYPEYLATTEDVKDFELGPTSVLADIRRWEEFTGAPGSNTYLHFDDEGRIPGVVWAQNSKDYGDTDGTIRTKMETIWEDCGITSDKNIIFYCGTGWRSSLAFFYGYLLGYNDIVNYDGGFFGWTWDEDNPVETGNTEKLVSASWVNEMIENNNDGDPYVIIQTGWGAAGDDYNKGHIPGAIWVNTDEIEYDCFNARNDWPVDPGTPPCWDRSTTEEEDAAKGLGPDDSLPRNWWNLYPDEYLLPAIAYMGIDKDTTVVVYGKSVDAAARILWALMYAGVEDVRLLDGGKTEWEAAEYDLETTANERTPVDIFDPDDPDRNTAIHPEYKVDILYVRDVVNGVETDGLIVDIRSWDEYIGASRPYSYIPTDGRIPGAVWGTDDFRNADRTLMAASELYLFWNSQGISSEKHLSFYCGTAWRSSLAWFYTYIMGFPEISNFDSSWFEWSMGGGSAYNGDDPVLNPIVDDSPDLP